jgi:hypothetical protein
MTNVDLDVPDEAMRAIAGTPDAFICSMRLAAAMFWYGRNDVTMAHAAAIAGVSQNEFMASLKEAEQPTTAEDLDALDAELSVLAQRRPSGGVGG